MSASTTPSYPSISQPNGPPTSFAVILYPGFQLLDIAGPLDLLNTLSSNNPSLTIHLLSSTLDPVPVKHPALVSKNPAFSQSFVPTDTYTSFLTSCTPVDVLLIPGGIGSREPPSSINPTLTFLAEYFSLSLVRHSIFTICTGSRVLAATGYLNSLSATTNKLAFHTIKDLFPEVKWVKKARWVRDGQIWTCSGVSAGMDGMVAFIQEWWGEETARELCWFTEYRWCGMQGRELDEFAEGI